MCLGIPGKVVEINEPDQDSVMRMGKVQFGGISKEVCLAYLPEVQLGDYVLVHVGFAISKVDEEEAAEIFSYIDQLGELSDANDPFDAQGMLAAEDFPGSESEKPL